MLFNAAASTVGKDSNERLDPECGLKLRVQYRSDLVQTTGRLWQDALGQGSDEV